MAENLSGVPPTVTLSGLGVGGAGGANLSGTNAQGIGGTAASGAGFLPGMEGGMDLATLMQMLQQGDATQGLGVGGSINQGVGAGSFGSAGGLGSGSFGQTQPGYVAGMSSMGGQTQGQQAAAGAVDPASILQKFLGVAQQGAGLLGGTGTASPTLGDTGGTSLSDQVRSSYGDPFANSYSGVASAPSPGEVGGPMPTQAGDPTQLINQYGVGSPANQETLNALLEAGMSPDDIQAIMGGLEGATTGPQGTGGLTTGTGTASPATAQGTDYLGGGLGALQGLLSLYQGSQSGNVGSLFSGTGSALAGANQLTPGLGLGEMGQGLGLAGGAVNAPFAALSLANAIDQGDPAGIAQGLASLYGTTVPVINSIFGSSLPTLTSLAGQALSAVAPSLASSLGITAGAAGGAGAAAGGGAAAGAAAGGAAAAAPLAMLTGPYVIAKLIQAWQAMGPDKANARQLGNRVENIYGQLPGELQTLAGIPKITSQLSADSSPEQAADVLKQLNAMQGQFQTGGWEDYLKAGQTGVESVGVGNMHAQLPQVQQALDRMQPFLAQMDVARLRAQDMLSKAGWTPEQIQAQTGRYISPEEWAMNANAQPYHSTGNPYFQDFNPTFNTQFRPQTQESLMGTAGVENVNQLNDLIAAGLNVNGFDPRSIAAARPASSLQETNFGAVDPAMLAQLQGIAPGGLEQGLSQFLGQYGGVNPMWSQLGFGQGLAPGMQRAGAVSPQIMAAANSPRASTAGAAQGLQQGKLQEETLMDLLRRMSPGAAYQGV